MTLDTDFASFYFAKFLLNSLRRYYASENLSGIGFNTAIIYCIGYNSTMEIIQNLALSGGLSCGAALNRY